jgi:hypothetical protein
MSGAQPSHTTWRNKIQKSNNSEHFFLSRKTSSQFSNTHTSVQNSRKFSPNARGILIQLRAVITLLSSPKCPDWIRGSPASYLTGYEPLSLQVQGHGSEADL